jgi:hypothetical protein
MRDEKGREITRPLELSTHDVPNPAAPWYRATGRQGDRPHHSWFIGYAPAEKPQIAFAVLVEYGGSGGGTAGTMAADVLKLCMAHGHLKPTATAAPAPAIASVVAAPLAPSAEVELLHDLPATTRAARQ